MEALFSVNQERRRSATPRFNSPSFGITICTTLDFLSQKISEHCHMRYKLNNE